MMRGDTLTAGIGRFTGAVRSALIEYRICGDLFPGASRKGTLGKNSVRGNKFGGLGVLERDTSFERDLKVDFCPRDLFIENFRFHRQSEVDCAPGNCKETPSYATNCYESHSMSALRCA